jgi:hypothetical protein
MWAASIPNQPPMSACRPIRGGRDEDLAWCGALGRYLTFATTAPALPTWPAHAGRGLFRSDARHGGMNFYDARGCYESEASRAAFLSTNPKKTAMWEPARVEA